MFETGPCQPWITAADISCGDAGDRASAAQAASDVLFYLSGAVFTGQCTSTVRPGRDQCGCGWLVPHEYWWHARQTGFEWIPAEHRVLLGVEPVNSVTSVVVDGDTLDAAEYHVENYRWLVRDDCTPWPLTDTWTVTVATGIDPPEMGVRAAKALACDLIATAETAGGDCDLPSNTQSFVRQGLQVQMVDDLNSVVGSLNLPHEADLFLNAYNPHRLTGNAIVAVPGQHLPTTVTWP